MNHRMLVLAKKIVSEMKDFYQVNEPIKVKKSDIETIERLIEQAEKAEKYREALEFYAGGNHYSDKLYDYKIILLDDGEKARQALEGEA